MTRITSCPRCGAKTEQEAQTACRPGEDACPMTCEDDFEKALICLAATDEVLEQQARDWQAEEQAREAERARWAHPSEDMLKDAGLR